MGEKIPDEGYRCDHCSCPDTRWFGHEASCPFYDESIHAAENRRMRERREANESSDPHDWY